MPHFFQRNIRRALFGVLGVTLIAGGLSACGHHRDHGWGANATPEQFAQQRDRLVDRAASKLDLNAEQKKLLAVVGDKLFEQRKAMMGQTTDPCAELKSLVAGPKFDTAKAQALITDKTTAMQARSPETLAALAAYLARFGLRLDCALKPSLGLAQLPRELVARLQTALRRRVATPALAAASGGQSLRFDGLVIEPAHPQRHPPGRTAQPDHHRVRSAGAVGQRAWQNFQPRRHPQPPARP